MADLNIGVQAVLQHFGNNKSAVAEALGIERSAVSQWKRVPVKRVLELEKATAGKVSRHVMRPDVYPAEAA
jgi:DNA-binding transcriptional regulator YdaS (Cro superfamily)